MLDAVGYQGPSPLAQILPCRQGFTYPACKSRRTPLARREPSATTEVSILTLTGACAALGVWFCFS